MKKLLSILTAAALTLAFAACADKPAAPEPAETAAQLPNPVADVADAAGALPENVGVLVECGRGVLPGGNGAAWRWADAAPLAARRPFAVAGGITPDTAVEAVRAARARAVDVSSGVEAAPGRKDLDLVRRLIERLRAAYGGPASNVFSR